MCDSSREAKENGKDVYKRQVWFGESVPMIETAIEYAETADIFLIIGTSLNVLSLIHICVPMVGLVLSWGLHWCLARILVLP